MTTMGYKLTHDTGFAPNPFHGHLTLATCKPMIRRCRRKDDWVAGFVSKALADQAARNGISLTPGSLVHLMEITEAPIPLEDYFEDRRFAAKKPDMRSFRPEVRCGDNIYYHLNGGTGQIDNENHGHDDQPHDLGGVNALISNRFYYFGRNAFLPQEGWTAFLGAPLSPGRTFLCQDSLVPRLLARFERECIGEGLHGAPSLWPQGVALPQERTSRCRLPQQRRV
ncbi:MAG: Nmad2 family putative nucleotide modification protein [Acidiferrobacter sp.]